MNGSEATTIIVGVIVVVGLFFLLRELFCWYWKINRIVGLLERIAGRLAPDAIEAPLSPFEAGKAAHIKSAYATAFGHWKPLADQGDARTQNNIGIMYEEGQGVKKDLVEALKWFNLAVAASSPGEQHDRAIRNQQRVAGKLRPEDVAEAERRAREWKPSPVAQA